MEEEGSRAARQSGLGRGGGRRGGGGLARVGRGAGRGGGRRDGSGARVAARGRRVDANWGIGEEKGKKNA